MTANESLMNDLRASVMLEALKEIEKNAAIYQRMQIAAVARAAIQKVECQCSAQS